MSVDRDTWMHISPWILEFLLRQKKVEDHLLNTIISVLPLPGDNPSLKNRLILRKIESDAQKGIISEDTLNYLEQIEELEHREGIIEASKAMKMAYCAVAVHCTVKFLEESVDDEDGKYCRAVGKIWRGKIRKMVRFDGLERVGLVSDDLISWMDDIEAGLRDVNACEKLLVRYKGLNVLEVLQGYLHEAEEKMGPSFLELVAKRLSEEKLRDIMRLRKDENASGSSKINETIKTIVLPRREFKDKDRPRKVRCLTHRLLKIADTEEETAPNKYDDISTPEVSKVQEAPATNTLELPQMVKDPLLNSLKATIDCENTGQDHDKNSEALQADREVNKVQEAPATDTLELPQMVKDPLPNSLKATIDCENMAQDHDKYSEALQADREVSKVQEAPATNTLELPQMVKGPLPNSLKATIECENMAQDHDKKSEALQADRDDVGLCFDQNKRPKFSPMVKRVLPNSLKATIACGNMAQDHDKNSEALQADRDGRGLCFDQNKSPKFSTLEPNSTAHTVEDPLPNASKATIECENMAHDLDKNSEALQADRDDLGLCNDQNKRPKFSTMEPNSTAHTVQLGDSIGGFDDGSQTRHDLHSPKEREPSPLKESDYKRFSRKRKKWSNVEEDTLRAGVQKHGKGNWKLILTMYRDKFEDRTEIDLKDKWRNLTRC